MKASVVVVGLVCVAGAFVGLATGPVTGTEQKVEPTPMSVPASLQDFYPPKSPGPVYLLAMLELARPFGSLVADVQEQDMINAQANFEAFKKIYLETSNKVAEWKDRYPLEPVEELGKALAGGDPSAIMSAVDAVGRICDACHYTSMAPVEQMYRWDDFADVVATDPLSGNDVSFADLMLMLETNFQGIGNNLAQGQKENALKQFAGFNARFQAMADACMTCHDTERSYYVSKDITDLISGLQVELTKPQIEMGVVLGLIETIGNESCAKCHLVHIPAAYGQQMLKTH